MQKRLDGRLPYRREHFNALVIDVFLSSGQIAQGLPQVDVTQSVTLLLCR